ncbi:hypothetical protein DSM112329_03025 [Paraconexibacter sp. AEG42_29]|uniref:Non-specific protein-tyrosine kinase n=1 Tax=Paraconexibacter sp. AEG42_29 TaxID=2997339 RepID=A0AAU7AXH5_9ACTN
MHDAQSLISLTSVFALLRRNALLVGLTVVLAVGASVAISASQEPKYEASAQIGYASDEAELQAIGIPSTPSFQPEKEIAAAAERITSPAAVARVIELLELKQSPEKVQSSVSTTVEVASNLVAIDAEASDEKLAADLANTFASVTRTAARREAQQRYRAIARDTQARARRLKGEKNAARRAVFEDQAARLLTLASFARPVDVVRRAVEPSAPTSPKPVRNAVLAGLLGLMLGVALASLRQAFDRRLRDPSDVESAFDDPVLGQLHTAALGHTPWAPRKRRGNRRDEDVEPFRILRTNLALVSSGRESKTVLVSSPLPAEGKSTVAIGLAWAEAMTGRRTLLVDCDLRRPSVAERLGIPASPGLADFLRGDAEPSEIVHSLELEGLSGKAATSLVCIPAGAHTENHAELLESERFENFLAQVSEVYDRIILDSAPLLPVSDTLALLPRADCVVLCLRLGQTTRDDGEAAKATLDRADTKSVGLVITAADKSQGVYYTGSYGYSSTPAGASS